jgi:hypothetical protein
MHYDYVLITPTGDRPYACELCQRYILRQTFRGTVKSILVNDGTVPIPWHDTVVSRKRVEPEGVHTLPHNLLAAVEYIAEHNITFNRLAVIEDDDWYHYRYLDVMYGFHLPLVGLAHSPYYYLAQPSIWHQTNEQVSPLASTVIDPSMYPTFVDCVNQAIKENTPYVDGLLWKHPGVMIHAKNMKWHVGMKGMPGRIGVTKTHTLVGGRYRRDIDYSQLKKIIGDDVEKYKNIGQHVRSYTY